MKRPATIVPPLTPFTSDLRVDYDALAKGVDYVVDDCNATVVIAAGVEAQEYQYLGLEERKELIRNTIDFVNRRRPVTVGVSHPSFRISIELAAYAASMGAQSIQLLAPQRPTGGPPTTAELVRYYEAVGRETELPIMLYLNAGPGADVSVPADSVGLANAATWVEDFAARPPRAAGVVVKDEGDGGTKAAGFLAERKFI